MIAALRRTLAAAWIETLLLVRDRSSLSLILVVPAIEILLFGYAINLQPKGAVAALAGPQATAGSSLARALAKDGAFRVVAGLPPGAGEARVRSGEATVAGETPVPPPPEALSATPPTRVVVDGSDPSAAAALSSLQERASSVEIDAPDVRLVRLFNPDGRSAWVLAPALVGVIVMISTLMLGAQALVREREDGVDETLRTTPIRAGELMVGKLLPYLVVAMVQASLALGLARWVFEVPARGAWPALLAGALLFAAAHLALGLAISAVAQTRLQAIQAAVFFYLPSILLSGFMFPFRGMPVWARAIGEAMPLTHFIRASRGALLRGADAGYVWSQMAPVALFGIVAAALAATAYRFMRR